MLFDQRFRKGLFQPVDASSLVVFRIGFGLVMLWEVIRYWRHDWIREYYIEPVFQFKYYGFAWVQPWPGDWMYAHFAVLGICAFFIALGLFYRISTILFLLGFSYVFLLEQANYLNHLYLVIVCAALLCVLPANRYFSLDAKLRPYIAADTVPAWSVWILRAQFEIVLLYAGIVKLNGDWLQLEPLSMWLAKRADFPVLGPLFMQDWSVAVAAYGVILLHLLGAPLLLYRRTRLYVFFAYAAFHTLNHFVFSIGIFPWFTLLGSLMFFDPDWPKQLKSRVLGWLGRSESSAMLSVPEKTTTPVSLPPPVQQRAVIGFAMVWLGVQILLPLRHVLYPGNVSWTEEGHKYAWQMKLRDKKGETRFFVTDPATGRQWEADPLDYLSPRQARKMQVRPDMILQFAHLLAQRWEQRWKIPGVEVRVDSWVSLNGRERAQMIDPNVDLAKRQMSLLPADWILPLRIPLNRRPENYRARYRDLVQAETNE